MKESSDCHVTADPRALSMAEGTVLQAHRARFLVYEPHSIHCLAFSEDDRLAVARSDGSVELWKPRERWRQVAVCPGRTNASVEVLLWCRNRLYSSGLDGSLVQWDVSPLQPAQEVKSSGGAVWCMAARADMDAVAAGCEDGCVQLYGVSATGELWFTKRLGPQDGRVLSVAWEQSGAAIFAGGLDSAIRRYNVRSGVCDLRITLDDHNGRSTLVWSLVTLDEHLLCSGDSTGAVQFWDSQYGTLRQKFKCHLADVLSLAASGDRKMVFAGGIDQKVVRFKQVQSNAGSHFDWVHSGDVICHSHDVRAVCLSASGLLVSGGVDTTIVQYNLERFKKPFCTTIYPFPQCGRQYQVAEEGRVLLHQRQNCADIWQLSTVAMPTPITSATSTQDEAARHTHAQPTCLVRLKLPQSAVHHLQCSAISRCGSLVCLSNMQKLWLYRLLAQEGKVKLLLTSSVAARHAAILSGNRLIIADKDGSILLGTVDEETGSKRHSLSFRELVKHRGKPVTFLQESPDDEWLAVVYEHKEIVLVRMADEQEVRLPAVSSSIAQVCFHYRDPCLFIACTDRQILHCSLTEQRITEWIAPYEEQENGFPQTWGPILGMTLVQSAEKDILVLACQECSIFVNASALQPLHEAALSSNKSARRAGSKRKAEDTSIARSWSKLHRKNHLLVSSHSCKTLFVGRLASNQLVVGEKMWSDVASNFSSPIFRKCFQS